MPCLHPCSHNFYTRAHKSTYILPDKCLDRQKLSKQLCNRTYNIHFH